MNNNGFAVADEGDGFLGNETEFFGKLTKSALVRFQIYFKSTSIAG
ncbi:MAG: hypothetical protein Q8Q48_00055 [Candidatus Staskawiczbacteria bacterium]|nr:hypothetical protein [Candidatus Staskawiczbacteria bacterium]